MSCCLCKELQTPRFLLRKTKNVELLTHPLTKWEHEKLQQITWIYQGKLLEWLDMSKNICPMEVFQFYLWTNHKWMIVRLDTLGSIELSFHSSDSGMEKQKFPGDKISDKTPLLFCFLGFFFSLSVSLFNLNRSEPQSCQPRTVWRASLAC